MIDVANLYPAVLPYLRYIVIIVDSYVRVHHQIKDVRFTPEMGQI